MAKTTVKRVAASLLAAVFLAFCVTVAPVAETGHADARTLSVSTQAKSASTASTTSSASTSAAKAKKAKKKYDIIFKLNGGKQAKNQVLQVKKGKKLKVKKLKDPKRSGYMFMGWYTNAKLTKPATVVKGVSTKSKRTVRAKWVKIKMLPINYELNGGQFVGTYTKKFKNNKAVKKFQTPARSGYTFAGWYADPELTVPFTSIARAVTTAPTLYAKWEPIVYNIAYVTYGGTLPEGYVNTYSADDPVAELPTPTRAGYSFMGWFADRELTQYADSVPGTARGNQLFYAKWRKRVLVAHRGLVGKDAPENSVAAFSAAKEKGFTEFETDVRFTSDGQPVLVHDETIPIWSEDPETGAKYKEKVAVADLSYEDLMEADLARNKSGVGDDNVATFEDALRECVADDIDMLVHLKTDDVSDVDTLIELVKEYQCEDKVQWFTSSLSVLQYVKTGKANARFVYSHTLTQEAAREAAELGTDGADAMVHVYYTKITPSKLKYFKSLGVPVSTWGYENEKQMTGLDQYVSMALVDDLVADYMPENIVY